jgi:pilus assembly protein CpaB
MLTRFLPILLIALGLAGLGAVAYVTLSNQPAPTTAADAPPPAPIQVQIIAASRAVRAGALLGSEDLGTKDVLSSEIPAGAQRDSAEARAALRGGMVRHSLEPGQPVLQNDVLNPGDRGFLAAVLTPDMRAVSVGVDAVSGTAGLIWPGDRVDLILTQSIEDQNQPRDRRVASETVLQDLRVIAVDQHLVQGAEAPNGNSATANNRTITLEASPEEAERITVAAKLGRLALAARPALGSDRPATVRQSSGQIVWGGDVSPALQALPGNKSGAGVRVFRGTQDAVEFKF